MESIILTTPSGYKVTFKPYVSFGAKRQIQRVFLSSARVKMSNLEDTEIDASANQDAEDLAVKLLVTSIDIEGTPSITEPGLILNTIQDWPEADGQAVYDKINELAASPTSKKKGA